MNKVYAIIGPPASGKTSIVKRLLKESAIPALVSHTTRPAKKNEQDGVDYYFVDKSEFSRLPLVERAAYSGNYYGLSKDEVSNKVNANPVTVVDIDINGFEQLKKFLGVRLESIYILIDKDTILGRLISQGETSQEIVRRIDYAEKSGEFDVWRIADHVVKNTGSIDTALRQVLAIMNLPLPANKG